MSALRWLVISALPVLGSRPLTVAVTSDCPCRSEVSLGERGDSDAGSDYCVLCHDQCACGGESGRRVRRGDPGSAAVDAGKV